MNPMTCMIVDDEPLAVRLLESYVEKTPDLELMASFTDSITAINAVKARKPDLLFLDIQMPNIDGMELAHSLPEETRVVFTTAFKEYAFESYEVNALDFLLKPIRYNKFLAAVEKAKKLYQQPIAPQPQQPNSLFIRVEGEWRNIAIDKITQAVGQSTNPANYLLAQKYIQMLDTVASGDKTKTVYLPYEATNLLGSIGGIKELFGNNDPVKKEK